MLVEPKGPVSQRGQVRVNFFVADTFGKVLGFIVSLPHNWTKYEYNDTGMHQTVVAMNETPQPDDWT